LILELVAVDKENAEMKTHQTLLEEQLQNLKKKS